MKNPPKTNKQRGGEADARLLRQAIGEALRDVRTREQMRQQDMAEQFQISTDYWGLLERGVTFPSLETLYDILETYGISADRIIKRALDAGWKAKAPVEEKPMRPEASILLEKIWRMDQSWQRTMLKIIKMMEEDAATRGQKNAKRRGSKQ